MIQECGGDDWGGEGHRDPVMELRNDSLEYAIDILSAHAADAGPKTPEQIGQAAVTVAQTFESYLAGGSFGLPMPPMETSDESGLSF